MKGNAQILSCRDHERIWQGRCVDKNIKDSWLESLNNLKSLDLINICEGHAERESEHDNQYPHIYLTLKAKLIDFALTKYRILIDLFKNGFDAATTSGDTILVFDLRHFIIKQPQLTEHPLVFRVNIKCKKKRMKEDTSEVVEYWFNNAVSKALEIDKQLSIFLNQ